MSHRLEKLYELRVLWAASHLHGRELSELQRARMHRLLADFQPGVPSLDPRDPYTALGASLSAELSANGHHHVAAVGNLGAGGAALSCAVLPELDTWVTLAIQDEAHGIEYVFPGRVVARVLSGPTSLGLGFTGSPAQRLLRGRSSGVWVGPGVEADAVDGEDDGRIAHRHRRLADD